MSADEKKNTEATITRLANEGSPFFKEKSDDLVVDDDLDVGDAKTPRTNRSATEPIPVLELLREANMLVPDSGLGQNFYDEYRRIKRPLLSNAFGKSASLVDRGNLILVTSSLPGEGKTHTAINLALSIAQEKDRTVLLVDCDAIKQGASSMLGIEAMRGLVDVLENDNCALADVLLRTDIHNLSIVPSGIQSEYITELLASQRMADMVDEIAARYDDRIIIFDGPPLIPTPQCQVLTGLVGQVVFVIEAAKTPHDVVHEALEMISEEKATGLIMNKSEGSSSRSDYYYGYSDSKDSRS